MADKKLYALTDEQVAKFRKMFPFEEHPHFDTPIEFAAAVKHFHDPEDAGWIAMAQERYQDYGSIEIDDDAILSKSDEGAYVMAWVWISNEDMGVIEEDENAAEATGDPEP